MVFCVGKNVSKSSDLEKSLFLPLQMYAVVGSVLKTSCFFICHPFVVLVSFLPLSSLYLSFTVFYCSFSQKLSLFSQFVGVSAHISSVCLCLMSNKEQKYESAPLPSLSAGTIKIPLLCCPKERAPARMTSFCLCHEPAPPYFSKSRCASGWP
jgi:hypothetical protein